MNIASLLAATVVISAAFAAPALAENKWPTQIPGIKPAAPGEHPRLLFREADLPALKAKAKTPEGQAIIKRLKQTLDGAEGDTFPKLFSASGKAYDNKGVKPSNDDDGMAAPGDTKVAYTYSHAAGYGLLYQLTGDKKYAELGRMSFEKAFEGVRDRDDRYSWRAPGGALRAGPSMGWYALGYDLCYDGWDDSFRKKVAEEFNNYPGGGNTDKNLMIENCIAGKRQHPGSNHWGMQVGGAAMALMAIWKDPGTDMQKFEPLWTVSQGTMVTKMTKGFGDGGFFAEGDGTGSMASHIAFLPALQAWKTGYGIDFITPEPNAQWLANRWFVQTISKNGKPNYQPQRGGYPHNIWARTGVSGGGYFSIGLGVAANDDVKAAILWYYENGGFKAADEKAGTPCDTPSPYPHHAVLSFVNWPVGMKPKNPKGIIPNAVCDSKYGFYLWRDKWEDDSDVVVSILSKVAHGNMSAKAEKSLSIVQGMGKPESWGNFAGGFKSDFKPDKNGSTSLITAGGDLFAVDSSGASGASMLLIATGKSAGKGTYTVSAGGKEVTILALGKGTAPEPKVAGNTITIGGQTITLDDSGIKLAK